VEQLEDRCLLSDGLRAFAVAPPARHPGGDAAHQGVRLEHVRTPADAPEARQEAVPELRKKPHPNKPKAKHHPHHGKKHHTSPTPTPTPTPTPAPEPSPAPGQAPALGIQAPQAGLVTNHDPAIQGQVTAGAALSARVDAAATVTVPVSASGSFTFTPGLPVDGSHDGAHTVHFTATDPGSGLSSTAAFPFTLDTLPPAVTVQSPTFGQALDAGATTLPVSGRVADAGGGVATLQAEVDAGTPVALSVTTSTGAFAGSVPLTGLATGFHTLRLFATDQVGNKGETDVSFALGQANQLQLQDPNGLVAQIAVPVALGPASGSRTLSFTVSPQWDTPAPGTVGGDRLLVYLVDPAHPGQTLLAGGGLGTPLFALPSQGPAEFLPGLVRFDGSVVQIDATSLSTANGPANGQLVFQLVNGDGAAGSSVQVQNIADTVDPSRQASPVYQPGPDVIVPAGPALSLPALTAGSGATVLVSNVRVDAAKGTYTAELRLRNDGGAPLARDVAVVFPGLPAGVQLVSPSGADATGAPYLNLHGAIPPGGLTAGTTSEAVLLRFTDPGLLAFALKPDVLVGAPPQPPTLAPVGPLSVTPGGQVQVKLQASTADGDPVAFSVRSSDPLPTGTLQADGTLVFDPAPGEAGTYTFTVVASDGTLEATQPVTLTVFGTAQAATSISGVVEDTGGNPVAGVPVSLGTLQTTTAADGTYTLHFTGAAPSDTIAIHADQVGGPVSYAPFSESISQNLGHPIDAGFDNVISRPAYLVALDTAGAVTVNPNQATTVTSSTLPGASLVIPAGSLRDQNGSPYAGKVSLTTVPPDRTPVPLPPGEHPAVAIMVEAVGSPGTVLSLTGGTLTLPNAGGNSPGAQMWLNGENPVTGQVAPLGLGQVSGNGRTFEFVGFSIQPPPPPAPTGSATPGVMSPLTAPPAPPPPPTVYYPGPKEKAKPKSSQPAKCECENQDGAPGSSDGGNAPTSPAPDGPVPEGGFTQDPSGDASPFSSLQPITGMVHHANAEGSVGQDQPVGAYQSEGVGRQLTLHYESLRADPTAVVHVQDSDPNQGIYGDPNPLLAVRLAVNVGNFTIDQPGGPGGSFAPGAGVQYYSLPAGGAPASAGVEANLGDLATGTYSYTATVGTPNVSGSVLSGETATAQGSVVVVNSKDSPFGSGWTLSGWAEVVPNADDSALLVDGDGNRFVFDAPATPGGPYTPPPGDFSTLVRLADGTFRRTLPDQTVYTFNAGGQLAAIKDRNGNTTTFAYDASGHLTSLTDPVGQKTAFGYNGGLASTITTPDGRATQLRHDAAGNLTAVTLPGGATQQYAYDARHLLTTATDPDGNRSTNAYDFAGRVRSMSDATGSTVRVSPPDVQDVRPADLTADPTTAPLAATAGPLVATTADANGNVTTTALNDMFQFVSSTDAVGPGPGVHRNAQDLVSQGVDGLRRVQLFGYDANGNQVSSRDSLSPASALISGTISKAGEQHRYTFTGTVGQRLFYEDLGTGPGITYQLTAPNGAAADLSLLTESGTYTLTLTGSQPGTYRFSLVDLAAAATPLALNAPVSGTLDPSLGPDFYQFTGSAGQRLHFHVLDSGSAGGWTWQVFGPNGTPLSLYGGDAEVTLTESGSYVMVLKPSGTAAADYAFEVAAPATTTAVLTLNTPTTATLTLPGDVLRYTFTGQAGQRVYSNPLDGVDGGLVMQLLAPDGTLVYPVTNFVGETDPNGLVTLPAAGTYTLVLTGDNPGAYPFQLLDVAAAPALALATDTAGRPGQAYATNLYTLAGKAGQQLAFHIESVVPSDSGAGTPGIEWSLFDKDGFEDLGNLAGMGRQVLRDFTASLPADGTYVVAVHQTRAGSPISYRFWVQDVTPAPVAASGFGTVHSGTVGSFAQISAFTFTAPAGLPVYLQGQDTPAPSGQYQVQYTVLSSAGLPVAQTGTQDGLLLVTPTSGTYTVQVTHEGVGSASYQCRALDLTTSATPLTLGQLVSATLPAGNQSAVYQVTATPGHQLFLDGLGAASGQVGVQLFDRAGDTSTLGNDQLFPVAGDGTDYLFVTNLQATAVSYGLRLRDVATAAAPLSLTAPVSGTLNPPSLADLYQFTGTAGQDLAVSSQKDIVGMNLYAPGGRTLETDRAFFDGYTLPESGTYLLAVTGSGQQAMSYQLQAQLVTPTTTTASLTPGALTSGTLAGPYDVVQYPLQGTPGEHVFFSPFDSQTGTSTLRLTGPDGGSVNTFDGVILTEAGTYTVSVTGPKADTYRFRLFTDAAAPAVTAGTPVNGAYAWGQDAALYRFAGTAGQRLDVTFTAGSGTWTVYGPDGKQVATNAEAMLPADGTYLLLLQPYNSAGTFPQDYTFQVVTPATTTTALTFGTTYSGALPGTGDQQRFTFAGTAGQRIFLDDLGSSGYQNWGLTSPSGQSAGGYWNPGADNGPYTLAENGTYTFTIFGGGSVKYSLRLLDVAAAPAPALALGTTPGGTLSPGNAAALYRFTGKAGQRLSFHSVSASDRYGATWALYGPNDNQVTSNDVGSDFTATLPADGSYVLAVLGSSPGSPVTYQSQATDVSDAPVTATGFGTVQSGTVPAGGQTSFTFTAPAGLPVYFNNQTASGSPLTFALNDASGNEVLGTSGSYDTGPKVLSSSGKYTLVVQNSGSSSADFRFRLLDLSHAPPLTPGTAVSGTLASGAQTDVYRLAATVGQRLLLDPAQSSLGGVSVREADYTGSSALDLNSSLPLGTVPFTGTYYVMVTGSQAAGANYRLRFDDVAALPALADGTTLTDSAAAVYRFAGTAGQRLYFANGSSNPLYAYTLNLYGPDNRALPGDAIATLGNGYVVTLPADDTYVVLPVSSTLTPAAYNFQVSLPATTTGPLTLLSAAPGQHVAYDPVFNLPTSVTDELGRQTQYQLDPATGNVLSATQAAASGNVVTKYTYTPTGEVATATDPLGRVTAYAYDSLGRTTQVTYAQGTPDQAVVKYTYDAAGNVASRTDADGNKTAYQYDAMNRLVQVTDPLGDVTKYAYDLAGNLTQVTDARGNVTKYAYDAANRLIQTTAADGTATKDQYDGNGNLTVATDALGRATHYRYDARNRAVAVTDPLGQVTLTTYDANDSVLTVTDPLGEVMRYGYDARDRLVSSTDPTGAVTRTTHDAAGNKTSVTDPDGNTTTYAYDALNRLTSETDPLGAAVTYQYDAAGNRIAETDRDGRTRQFTYDSLDRLAGEAWLDGSGHAALTIAYGYDAAGRLTSASDGSSAYQFTYDADGRLTSTSNAGTPGVPAVVMTDTYDAAGNLLARADTIAGQAAGTTAYTYDTVGRMTQVTQSGPGVTPKRVDLAHDAAGQLTGVTRYADLAGTSLVASSQYAYDQDGRLKQLTDGHGATTIAGYTWTYDAAGRITSAASPDGSTSYTYDKAGQLTGATPTAGADETYSYDANGNRTNTGYQTGADNRLLSDGTYTYAYDAEGNRTSRTEIATGNVTAYQWDYRNRLVGVTLADGSGKVLKQVAYTYDVFDNRIGETVTDDTTTPASATTQRFVYDGNEVALQFDGTGALAERYLYGPAVDQIFAQEDGQGKVLWMLTDNLGSVRDVLDSAGAVRDHVTYDSFGRITSETNAATPHLFAYTGQALDAATGLYYYRARYYDASAGRFLSEDPSGFGGGSNKASYAGNDPITRTDPSGLRGQLPGWTQDPKYAADFAQLQKFAADMAKDYELYWPLDGDPHGWDENRQSIKQYGDRHPRGCINTQKNTKRFLDWWNAHNGNKFDIKNVEVGGSPWITLPTNQGWYDFELYGNGAEHHAVAVVPPGGGLDDAVVVDPWLHGPGDMFFNIKDWASPEEQGPFTKGPAYWDPGPLPPRKH
jgi:RHS repeat-associated protein